MKVSISKQADEPKMPLNDIRIYVKYLVTAYLFLFFVSS